MFINLFRLALGCSLFLAAAAQANNADQAALNAHFAPFETSDAPGFAVGIVRDGELVAEGYFGSADLQAGVPIDTNSLFYIGSMSKQFTAALIAILIEEGKLSAQTRLSEHLPDLPGAYAQITVEQALHHTAGLREYTSLLLLRGDDRSLQNRMNQSDAIKLIRDQDGLDFTPGSEQRYSSSGYVLLTALIEAIEGKSLTKVAKIRLFEPLGMHATRFDDNHGDVIAGRVQAYQPKGDGWRHWLKHFDVVGDGGVLTTIRDMALWDRELTSGAVLGRNVKDFLHARGSLSDGTPLTSGAGLWHDTFKGQPVVRHGGGLGGFIADQIRLPDERLSIYVFANRNDHQAFQAWGLANALVSDPAALQTVHEPTLQTPEEPAHAKPEAADPRWDAWLGAYFLDTRNNRRYLRKTDDGALALHGGGGEFLTTLIPRGGNRFGLASSASEITLTMRDGTPAMQLTAATFAWEALQYDDTAPRSPLQLSGLTGRFCSAELETGVTFSLEEGAFSMRYDRDHPRQLFPVPEGANIGWNGSERVWIGTHMLKFRVNADGRATSLGMGDGRVSNVEFERCA